ncbi:MAG: hypothetical protein PF448_01400 [Bacteroidales bacterium]|jgi:hypothetical protein|nr:hypothetical protein [Bacteroidales bacterium]
MRFILLIIALLGVNFLNAQQLALYNDYLDNVQIFDGGKFQELEHLPLTSYQIGNNAIGYEDNASSFKVYYNHYSFKVSEFVSDYTVTDNLIVFNLNNQLKVFDNGDTKTLAIHAGEYRVGDDLIAFYDKQKFLLNVYYQGEIIPLDDVLASEAEPEFIVGENTLVYKDAQGYLHIFYRGELFELLYAERAKDYKAGRDIVAFVETPVDNFQAFYGGEFIQLEDFEPKSFKMGDGFVAYIDSNDYLKLFDGTETQTISFDAPEEYDVTDELLVFHVQNYFKVHWRGKTYTLESHIPESYKMDQNILAYIDEQGYLKVFDRGTKQTLSYEAINEYDCHGNTVFYNYGINSNDIYYDGEVYSGD